MGRLRSRRLAQAARPTGATRSTRLTPEQLAMWRKAAEPLQAPGPATRARPASTPTRRSPGSRQRSTSTKQRIDSAANDRSGRTRATATAAVWERSGSPRSSWPPRELLDRFIDAIALTAASSSASSPRRFMTVCRAFRHRSPTASLSAAICSASPIFWGIAPRLSRRRTSPSICCGLRSAHVRSVPSDVFAGLVTARALVPFRPGSLVDKVLSTYRDNC